MVYKGPRGSLRSLGSWLAPGALEISLVLPLQSGDRHGHQLKDVSGDVLQTPAPQPAVHISPFVQMRQSGPRVVEGLPPALQPRLDLRFMQRWESLRNS